MEIDSKGIKWKEKIWTLIWYQIFMESFMFSTIIIIMKKRLLHNYVLRSIYNIVSVCILLAIMTAKHYEAMCVTLDSVTRFDSHWLICSRIILKLGIIGKYRSKKIEARPWLSISALHYDFWRLQIQPK